MQQFPYLPPTRLPHRAILPASLMAFACFFAEAPSANAATVIDQLGPLASSAAYDFSTLPEPSLSQVFADFPDFSTVVLENITVSLSQINLIEVAVAFRALGGFTDFSNVDGFLLNIFSDVGLAATSLTGDVASLSATVGSVLSVTPIVDTSGNHEYGLLRFALDLDLPGPGEYWLGVSPIGNASTLGQFMLLASPVPDLGVPDARLANPGEGFGIGPLSLTGNHHALSVTAVPEPGSTVLLITATLWLALLRRRSAS